MQLFNSRRSDTGNITTCHIQCFPGSLPAKLGKKYINKTFEWFLTHDNCVLFHILDEQHSVAGYCGGFISRYPGDGSTSGMMKYAMKEAFYGILSSPQLLFHKEVIAFYPLIFKNIFNKIFKKGIAPEKPSAEPFVKRLGLVVIGVAPAYRGKGVFEMLMQAFENYAKEKQITQLQLSVRASNARAIGAYKKAGWKILREEDDSVAMYKQIIPA